jgi:hypothetical protein
MTRLEQRYAVAVLSAFAPPGAPGLSPQEGEVDYLRAYTRLLQGSTALAALGLRAGLVLIALAPSWHWGKASMLVGLSLSDRARIVGELLRHRFFVVRELLLLVKYAASLALLGTPSVRERSGYDAVAQARYASLRVRPKAQARTSQAPAQAPVVNREAS